MSRSANSMQAPSLQETGHSSDVEAKSELESLWFLFVTFLKIGSVAFGGFMALISVIETTLVKQRGAISHKEMLDGVSLANMLPGPIAVNVVAFIGYRLRGGIGALVAVIGVILPSFVLVLFLSYLYFEFGQALSLKNLFLGFMPAVAAVVVTVAWRMTKKTVTGSSEAMIALAAAAVLILIPQEFKIYAAPGIILFSGFLGYQLFKNKITPSPSTPNSLSTWSIQKIALALTPLGLLVSIWFFPLPLENNSLAVVMLTFGSMSLMLFGGGYVFIPIIGSIVIMKYGWVSPQEFADGIALGQITPGPILISATFIGYKVSGILGALCATLAIFAPPALLMVTASQVLESLQRSIAIQAAMRAIHCSVIGMIFVASFVILQTNLNQAPIEVQSVAPTALIFVCALVAQIRFNLNVIWTILPAGALGYLLY